MSTTSTSASNAWWAAATAGCHVIDASVHPVIPDVDVIYAGLAPAWREFVDIAGLRQPPALGYSYPPHAPTSMRSEIADPSTMASADVIVRECLSRTGASALILNGYWGVDSIRNPDLAAALASAVNDWLIDCWLDVDPRLYGSMTIGTSDIDKAVGEIDRVGAHPRIVQVLLAVRSERPYGSRAYAPLLDAAVRNGIAVGLHFGGVSGNPPTPSGWPTYYLEEYVGMATVFQSQLTSLIVGGAFERLPDLRVALIESGFAWLPYLMWRLDKDWKGLRREVPWVRRAPSSYVRDHVRITSQPIDGPQRDLDLQMILDHLGGAELIMYATGYPHRHAQPPEDLLRVLDEPARAQVLGGNAMDFYRLELPEESR